MTQEELLNKYRQEDKEVVFDKHWFNKHQKKLLWLANSWLGKYIFRFKKMGHYLDKDKKISKITPYSVAQFNGYKKGKAEFTEHFFSRNEYARKLYWYLYPLWLAMHIWDWFVADHFQLAPQLSFGFSTLTQYPSSNSAGNPIDGRVYFQTDNQTWAAVRGGTGTNQDSNYANYLCMGLSSGSSSNWFRMSRGIMLFDTSSLTAGATISAGIFSLYGFSSADNNTSMSDADKALSLVSSNPASSTALVASTDYVYTKFGTTKYATDYAFASWSTVAYNDMTLNASGLSFISKTGLTKFGTRIACDVANTEPGRVGNSAYSQLSCLGAANGSNMPKLVVTYTLPVVSGGAFLFNMI